VTDPAPPRLLGLAQLDPPVPTTGAGAATKFLFDALERRFPMVDRRSVDLTPRQRRLVAALTFHPRRQRWTERFYFMRNLALNARSRNSARAVRETAEPFDFVVQVFGLFHTREAPYVLYIDNTAELSRRHWPDWTPLEGRALERLYAWERRLYRGALHVFAQGSPHAESAVSFYGAAPERVSVVGGGANFHPLPPLGSEPREPVVLFVGGEWHRKGGDLLLEAFRQVRGRIPEARLQIVGTSEAPDGLPGVEVLGRIDDRERLADLYRRAAVYCLPSRYDPYGLSVSEAMCYGLPCVVARVGALDEVVLDGKTGMVVPSESPEVVARALQQLLEDPALAERLGRAGRERVERHQNWDAVAERMEPALQRAAGEVRSRNAEHA
jgi:glycosyltransferase involved in cell wall biosynthesis